MAEHLDERAPTVIVSHLDITYRVLGAGRRGSPSGQGESPTLKRLIQRGRPSVGYREVPAVQDVSFVAHHGESIGIIGRNGSGKSTLLRAVAGLIPPTGGRLWVAGEPSLLGVNAVLMNKLSGERNIYIGGQALGLSKEEIRERFDDIVEFSGIGDAIYLPMGTYSSGMGARLRFAISTAAAPEVLMIDEALATGDAEFRERSAARIAEIRQQAGTVFLVSHSNSNIRQVCDRVLWMEKGRLIADGPTEEVLPEYEATLPKRGKGGRRTEISEPDVPGVARWGGENRLETAGSAVQHAYEGPVEGCFVVSVSRLAHARAVAPVAARLGWPLVWTRPSALAASTRDQLVRLQPGRVVVVGGEELVRPETEAAIRELLPAEVTRLGDDDASAASAELLQAFPPTDRDRLHVTLPATDGQSLSVTIPAAAHGRGILICDPGVPDPAVLAAVRELAPVTLVLSGTAEDWAPAAVQALGAASGREVTWVEPEGPMLRAAGTWRGRSTGSEALVAPTNAAVELLTAVAVGGATGRPVYLTSSTKVPDLVGTEMRRRRPSGFVLVAGIEAAGPEVRQQLGEILAAGPLEPEEDAGTQPAATASSAATKAGPPTDQS